MMFVGNAAMLLWFDVLPETIAEHDEWHTREHFPERIAIPGFRRASRWIATGPGPRYLVGYEVDDVAVLSSSAYLERLNQPSEWTRRMMPSYRGMTRAFFEFRHVVGDVLGSTIISVRFEGTVVGEHASTDRSSRELIAELCGQRGVSGAAFLASTREPEMTAEQRLRGRDAGAAHVLLVSLYDASVAPTLLAGPLSNANLSVWPNVERLHIGTYQLACTSAASDPAA